MTADCFLNGIILSLYHVRTVCEDFNSQAVFVFESKMMGRSSAYAVERWLLYRQHQGFTVSNGEGPDAAFCLGGIVMRQLDQVCESPDSENIQCALDFENTMNNLETQLYYRHLPPKEVALCVMEAACKFYDADWCGLIQVDLDLGLWKPLWWHNECQEDKTTIRYTCYGKLRKQTNCTGQTGYTCLLYTSTRWQGMMMEISLWPTAPPTACADIRVLPCFAASCCASAP